MRKAISIDFDGCLCTDAFPTIGEPNWAVINRAKAEQRHGAGLILWTCREGDLLQEAVDACAGWGLAFDSVNESLTDWIEAFGNRPRKVGASEYWDDKAVQMPIIQQTTNLPIPKQFQGAELIDKNAVLQALMKNGWLKMNALEDSAEMIAVQAIIYDAPVIILPPDAPPTDNAQTEPERHMRPIDALRALVVAINSLRYNPEIDPDVAATYERILVSLRDELCQERMQAANPPLTLEELREMDGEPVWIADLLIPGCSCYHFAQKISGHVLLVEPRNYPAKDMMIMHYCADDENQAYGETWLAYRRRPEDASK